jgi:hypothetical protein
VHCRAMIWICGLLCALASAKPSSGQQPWPSSSNAVRAYYHFLTSPYPYRTYSGSVMPYRVDAYTPYGYERLATGPGYVHQRITPHGFESYYAAPSWSYRVTPYPFVYVFPPQPLELRAVP